MYIGNRGERSNRRVNFYITKYKILYYYYFPIFFCEHVNRAEKWIPPPLLFDMPYCTSGLYSVKVLKNCTVHKIEKRERVGVRARVGGEVVPRSGPRPCFNQGKTSGQYGA